MNLPIEVGKEELNKQLGLPPESDLKDSLRVDLFKEMADDVNKANKKESYPKTHRSHRATDRRTKQDRKKEDIKYQQSEEEVEKL